MSLLSLSLSCYAGTVQTYTPILTGKYYLQVWGASGGEYPNTAYTGSKRGLGGYSYGYYNISDVTNPLYVIVGGEGYVPFVIDGVSEYYRTSPRKGGGYNGGGCTGHSTGGGGGGMSHISTTNNPSSGKDVDTRPSSVVWNSTGTLIVAGGGGGADDGQNAANAATKGGANDGTGGYGGGEKGGEPTVNGTLQSGYGGTQTSGYRQGIGQTDERINDIGGGGGGWWGGRSTGSNSGGGGGGSGYIGGVSTPRATIAGNQSFERPDVVSDNETGHAGNGYAKVTFQPYN